MKIDAVKKITSGVFIAIGVLIFPFLSAAEESKEEENAPSHKVELSRKYDLRSDARGDQQGSVQIDRTDFLYEYEFKAFSKLPVGFSLYNRRTGIDSTVSDVHLPAQLVEFTTDIYTTLPFFKLNNTYFRMGVEPSFYSDSWDFPSSGFRIPSYYYAIYRPNSKLILLCGLAVFPDTQNPVLPVLGFIYKPNDRLTFNIVPRLPNIEYALTDKISIFGEGTFSVNNEYEVKFNDSRRALLRFYETYLGGGIKYKPNKFISASFSLGGNFRRRLTYDDSLGKVNIKDGMYTQFRVEIRP